MEAAVFYILAAAALISALAAITRTDPLVSSLWLVGFVVSVAGLCAMLGAPAVAGLMIVISASVAMVLAIFVAMLMEPGRRRRPRLVSFPKVLGAVAAGYLAIVMTIAVAAPPFFGAPASGEYFESPLTLGRTIASRYALPFELVGVMLLVAAVAAVIIGKGKEAK